MFDRLTTLRFSDWFDLPLLPGPWPKTLKNLTFSQYTHELKKDVLPEGLKTLAFISDGLKPFEAGVLPSSLTTLQFPDEFNNELEPHVLPNSLTNLDFNNKFNQPLQPGVLPDNLKELRLGHSFNQRLFVYKDAVDNNALVRPHKVAKIIQSVLPKGLLVLEIYSGFNQPVPPGTLPKSLTYVNLGDSFNQRIEQGALPPHARIRRI